ncbi:hypothetical protein PUN4_1000004 [Paraburkholderia unamae]|uniref:hypothetical protein n=1 Tax=Paraburkholderia unamae TaxID=219649 RepID=UPI001CB354D1|nr:hypothetical protein [Paraburkholderia unamae]CAG9244353.1 hypothetical protein PUN4_1000004 [Paraburkholderia unamae]
MKAETARQTLSVDELLAVMEPDVTYHLHDLIGRTGRTLSAVRKTLDGAVAQQRIGRATSRDDARYRYFILAVASGRDAAVLHAPGELKDYDKQWRQFRAVCEDSRVRDDVRGV